MRRYEKMIKDPAVIAAMMDTFDTVYLGINDEDYPYVVPLSFGYDIRDGKLFVYVHSALSGYKLKLIEKDPRVCVTFSTFYDHHDHPYKSFLHDYRSVMAFGKIRMVKKTDKGFRNAVLRLLAQYNRDMTSVIPGRMMMMEMYEIECDWDMVFGKSERPVRTVEDVPYIDVYNVPEDNEAYYTADLLSRKIDNRWPRRNLDVPKEEAAAELPAAGSYQVSMSCRNESVDMDIMAFLLNENGKIFERNDILFYNYPAHTSGAVIHSGDDKITGQPEKISIDFEKMPPKYSRVVIVSSIYDAEQRGQHFADAQEARIRITASGGETVYEGDLAKLAPDKWGMIVGEFVKERDGWRFEKFETPTQEYMVAELSEKFGIRRDWRFIMKVPTVKHDTDKGGTAK